MITLGFWILLAYSCLFFRNVLLVFRKSCCGFLNLSDPKSEWWRCSIWRIFMVNIMHRKISFEDFQTETIGISVEMVLIDVSEKNQRVIDVQLKHYFFWYHYHASLGLPLYPGIYRSIFYEKKGLKSFLTTISPHFQFQPEHVNR